MNLPFGSCQRLNRFGPRLFRQQFRQQFNQLLSKQFSSQFGKLFRTTALLAPILALSALPLMIFVPNAEARLFSNAYVSFELPDKWNCTLEQTEYVCRTGATGVDSREAIIILTAKEVGPSDLLDLYVSHLKQARSITSRTGQTIQSTVYKVDRSTINNQPWIDGMHISSEVQNYYTRYLATTKGKIAILVTFSAHKLYYTKYNSDFFRAIQSLRVVADASLMNHSGGAGAGGAGAGGIFGLSGLGGDPLDEGLPGEENGSGHGSKGGAEAMMGFAVILLALGAYILLKKDKNKKKTKKKRPPAP